MAPSSGCSMEDLEVRVRSISGDVLSELKLQQAAPWLACKDAKRQALLRALCWEQIERDILPRSMARLRKSYIEVDNHLDGVL